LKESGEETVDGMTLQQFKDQVAGEQAVALDAFKNEYNEKKKVRL